MMKPDILKKIESYKREEIAAAKRALPLTDVAAATRKLLANGRAPE